jgi:predicted O-methyltransferase YrrM
MDKQLVLPSIERALTIDGWMTEPELLWLAKQASEHNSIVEVGSYLGRSTRALLDNTEGIVYAVDDWKGPRDAYVENRKRIFTDFCLNIEEHITNNKVRVIRCDHSDVQFDGKADMIFIDGSHEYEDVKRDILFWKQKLLPGGLLCGHDATYPAVAEAITETLGDAVIAPDTTIWWKIC